MIGPDAMSEQRAQEQPMGRQPSSDDIFQRQFRELSELVSRRPLSQMDQSERRLIRHHLEMMMRELDEE